MDWALVQADPEDLPLLTEIQLEAMHDSLAAVGHWDPATERGRTRDQFALDTTFRIEVGGQPVGFLGYQVHPDRIDLDELYLLPSHQGQGLGTAAVRFVQDRARGLGVPVLLRAIQGSPANRFYLSLGFEVVGQTDYENVYRWLAPAVGGP